VIGEENRLLGLCGHVGGAMGFTGPMGIRQIWAKNHTRAQLASRPGMKQEAMEMHVTRLSLPSSIAAYGDGTAPRLAASQIIAPASRI
jgi:hypothetical protein